jgi:hypothetical protein
MGPQVSLSHSTLSKLIRPMQGCAYRRTQKDAPCLKPLFGRSSLCRAHFHETAGRCLVIGCTQSRLSDTLACQDHQTLWNKSRPRRLQGIFGIRRAKRRLDDKNPWNPIQSNPYNKTIAHDDDSEQENIDTMHCFKPSKTYVTEVLTWSCGRVAAWTTFKTAESPTNLLDWWQELWPLNQSKCRRPSYLCIDKACIVLLSLLKRSYCNQFLSTTKLIVDIFHYLSHRSDDEICRTRCNPSPADGSDPGLVLRRVGNDGVVHEVRAYNSEVCGPSSAHIAVLST